MVGKWRLKVVLSNGAENRELLVLTREGDETYASVSGDAYHSSYHADGRRHVASNEPARRIRYKKPAANLDGVEELHSLSLRNESSWFTDKSPFRKLSARKIDLCWSIDSQRLPADVPLNLRIGVVGSGGRVALDQEIARLTADGMWTAVQSELHTGITPSPYLIVLSATDANPANKSARGSAGSSDAATLSDGQPFTLRFLDGLLGNIASGKSARWPPKGAQWRMQEIATVELSRSAPALVRVGDIYLAVARNGGPQRYEGDFVLVVNPYVETWKIKVGDQPAFRRDIGRQTQLARVIPMRFGGIPPGNTQASYDHDGIIYYIKCMGISAEDKHGHTQTRYTFDVRW